MNAKVKIDNGKVIRTFSLNIANEKESERKSECAKFLALASIIAEVETQNIIDKAGTQINEELDTAQNLQMNENIIALRLKGQKLEFDKEDSGQRLNMWMTAFLMESGMKVDKIKFDTEKCKILPFICVHS